MRTIDGTLYCKRWRLGRESDCAGRASRWSLELGRSGDVAARQPIAVAWREVEPHEGVLVTDAWQPQVNGGSRPWSGLVRDWAAWGVCEIHPGQFRDATPARAMRSTDLARGARAVMAQQLMRSRRGRHPHRDRRGHWVGQLAPIA